MLVEITAAVSVVWLSAMIALLRPTCGLVRVRRRK